MMASTNNHPNNVETLVKTQKFGQSSIIPILRILMRNGILDESVNYVYQNCTIDDILYVLINCKSTHHYALMAPLVRSNPNLTEEDKIAILNLFV